MEDQNNESVKKFRNRIQKEEDVSWITILFSIFAIITYVGDLGGDILTTFFLFQSKEYLYGTLSLIFTFVPTLIVNVYSILWWCHHTNTEANFDVPGKKRQAQFFQIVSHFFLCGVVARHIKIIQHGILYKRETRKEKSSPAIASRKSGQYLELFARERKEAAHLQLIECFLQDVLQFTLQIYIWANRNGNKAIPLECNQLCLTQLVSITFSLISFTSAIVNFQKCVHTLKPGETTLKISFVTTLVQFVWRLGTTGARMFAIILAILTYPIVGVCVLACHWLLMTFWFRFRKRTHRLEIQQNKTNPQSKLFDHGYDLLMGGVYIFCYLNLVDIHSAMPLAKYYVLTSSEDIVFVALWYFKHEYGRKDVDEELTRRFWRFTTIAFIYCNAFVVGIGAMIIYYRILRNSVSVHNTDDLIDDGDTTFDLHFNNSTQHKQSADLKYSEETETETTQLKVESK